MVKSADDEPHITLERWGVMQDICGYRLVGVAAGTSAGRVSSPVITYDGHAMTAETTSGRMYRLQGDPDPEVTAAIIKAHIVKWGLQRDEVAMAEAWELNEFLGPRPGNWVN